MASNQADGTQNQPSGSASTSNNRTKMEKQPTNPNPDQYGAIVMASSVQLPMFSRDDPEAWFMHTDNEFALRSITAETTKFTYLVSKLDNQTQRHVRANIISPHASQPYTHLKNILLQNFGLSEKDRANQLLDDTPQGDRSPTDIMMDLIALARDDDIKFVLKHLFLRKLPKEVRGPMGACKETDLMEFAKEATEIWRGFQDSQTSSVNAIQPRVQPRQRQQSSTSSAARQKREKSSKCWYHATWGDKARKCERPCSWQTGPGRRVNEIDCEVSKNEEPCGH